MKQKIVGSKIVPALFSVIVPEFMVVGAAGDLVRAQATMKDLPCTGNAKFPIIHSLFLQMDGFCLRSPSGRFHQLNYEDLLALGATSESKASPDPDAANVTTEISITPHTEEWIHKLEEFSEDDINALSKADSLTKVIACFQTLWFVTQVISRLGERRAVTLLEVSTCAYVFSAVIAYAAWWKKPQNCAMPLMIDCSDSVIAKLPRSDYEDIEGTWEEYTWGGARCFGVPNTGPFVLLLFGFPVFFGAIHVVSWNITLPSELELWMWRSSTVICISMPVICLVLLLPALIIPRPHLQEDNDIFFNILGYTILLLYVVVRLYMIVEVCVSMRALPRSAYDSITWSDALPNI